MNITNKREHWNAMIRNARENTRTIDEKIDFLMNECIKQNLLSDPFFTRYIKGVCGSWRERKAWKTKSKEIRKRDGCCCWCSSEDNLGVHHIDPLINNWDLRLENSNLITLCPSCHKKAENGSIPKEDLLKLIN